MRIEDAILSGLFLDSEYTRKALPHISGSYFQESADAYLYEEASAFFLKYNELPTKEVVRVQLVSKTGISESDLEESLKRLQVLQEEKKQTEWLLEKTEKFCKDKAVFNAIMQAITILDGKDKVHNKEAIPGILQTALGVSFDTAVGHAYLSDAASRFDFYSKTEEKLPFDIDILNQITNGGLPRKSLTLIMAQSGGGKSLVMTHMASANLRAGKNVLYITLEMAEERIAERIDANLLDVDIHQIKELGKDIFCTKISNIAAKTHGRLFIKEYPTGGAHSGHFRGLLEELKTKQNFVPDVMYVDYLGICASARVKMGGSVNSYAYLKAISEELRGLATEYNIPVVSGIQANRNGYDNSDISLVDIADSAGIIHTADLMLAVIRTEELDAVGQTMFKQLKNRYSDPGFMTRFTVGINRSRMKLYNVDGATVGLTQQPPAKSYLPTTKSEPMNSDTVQATIASLDSFPTAVIKQRPDVSGFNF